MTRPSTRWLVTGAGGMLGHDVLAVLAAREQDDVLGLDRAALDVSDVASCLDAVHGCDVVVNAAAYTKVDDAETHEPEAFAVNAVGAANLARACARHGATLVHISTDYVFDGAGSGGDAGEPYPENAPLAPRSAYGRTKAAGEWAVRAALPDRSYVLRTAWLYGEHGPSFVRTMLRLMGERETVDVVDDQQGQPTWSLDLAHRIVTVVEAAAPAGTYHATNAGSTTWCGLARAVFELAGADPVRVRPTTTDRFPRPAPRPAWSVLGHDGWQRAGLAPLRPWREALAEFLARC
jgi:dTDP-4-dehydrorhamnose reductase